MNTMDALRVLGVTQDSTPEAIKQSWRRKAAELHPDRFAGAEQAEKTKELAEVNAAWSLLKGLTTPVRQMQSTAIEIGVFYHARESFVAEALERLARQDSRRVKALWWSAFLGGFWRGRLPERPKPLTVVLCSAVVQDGSKLSILFEAPLPTSRAAVLIPTIKPGADTVQVYPDRPIVVEKEHLLETQKRLFSPVEMQAMGVERVDVVFPSRTLDITKTVRLVPAQGLDRLYYRT
jgi:DnaJ-domain-containing protein 1